MDRELKEKLETALADPSISDTVKSALSEARDKLDSSLSKKEKYEIALSIISILTNVAQIILK